MRIGLEALFALAWAALAYAVARTYGFEKGGRAAAAAAVAAALVAAGLVLRHHGTAAVPAAVAVADGALAAPHDVACRPAPSRAAAAARGSLDSFGNDDVAAANVTAGGSVHQADVLEVRGWAADGGAPVPVDAVCAAVDGRIVVQQARYGLARPDVASVMGSSALSASGYVDRFSAHDLAPGAHVVSVFGLRRGQLESIPGGSRRFVVVR